MVRITDRPDLTSSVRRGRKATHHTNKQQQKNSVKCVFHIHSIKGTPGTSSSINGKFTLKVIAHFIHWLNKPVRNRQMKIKKMGLGI